MLEQHFLRVRWRLPGNETFAFLGIDRFPSSTSTAAPRSEAEVAPAAVEEEEEEEEDEEDEEDTEGFDPVDKEP